MTHHFESGFFTATPAWHGLGKVLAHPPTTKEGLIEAGLDWEVKELPLYVYANRGNIGTDTSFPWFPCEDHKAIVRATDQRILGVVAADYKVLQNAEAFRFFDPFLQDGACALESAGSLKGGRRIWVLAKIKDCAADILPNDAIRAFLLLSFAHDGSAAVGVRFTPVRVVCWNTLSAAEADDSRAIKLRHTKGLHMALSAVQQSVDVARRSFSLSVEAYRRLASFGVNATTLNAYFKAVLKTPAQELVEEAERATTTEPAPEPRAIPILTEIFEQAPGQRLAGANLWGAYNAVTFWLDHVRGRTPESRFEAGHFGAGKDLRTRALDVAQSMSF